LRLIGNRGRSTGSIRIVACFPAEVDFSETSTNTIKDRVNQITVSWSSGELVTLLGRRLQLGLTILAPDRLAKLGLRSWAPEKALISPSDARRLLAAIFPPVIENGLGQPEPTFAYILRHTQLLPRHALALTNRVLARQYHDRGELGPVDPRIIPLAVAEAEREVADDILSAYATQFPLVRQILDDIGPRLGITFGYSELHHVYNQCGLSRSLPFPEFVSMSETMGIFGRCGRVSGVYQEADFQYSSQGNRLHLGPDDRIALHPVFSRYFSLPVAVNGVTNSDVSTKAVHPLGSWTALD
jgi:hypothetical protein